MTVGLALVLLALALLDSTSFGTLLIPIWLLLAAGRLRAARMFVYLGTVAGFYLVVGLVLVAGAGALLDSLGGLLASLPEQPLRLAQLAAGVALFAWSYRLEARADRAGDRPGRVQRWRARAMSDGGYAGLMGLALLATTLELATMLPYLGAIGLLATAELGWAATVAALAGYCVVMCLPAVLLAAGRVLAHQRIDPLLQRLNAWLTRNSGKLLGWTVGALGALLAINALANLALGELVGRSVA